MVDRRTRLRWRRKFRRHRRQVEDIGATTEENIDRHLVRRLTKLAYVRRFLFGWVGLICLLIIGVILQTRALASKYQVPTPVAGGIYTEGVLGTFTNANPIYASNLVDTSVSKLVFSGLLTYNEKGELVGDLAESYSYDPTETIYTVKLKKNISWHDGKQLTAKDVIFTYATIQNPEAKSPLAASWKGIKVTSPDAQTVVFTLPNKLSAFPHSMTNGIIPSHVLENVNPSQMRSNSFNNQKPIGTGPFEVKAVEAKELEANQRIASISLGRFEGYYKGKPSLERFIIKSYTKEDQLIDTFKDRQVDAIAGLSQLPDTIELDQSIKEYATPLAGQVMTFFRTSNEILSNTTVRKALVMGVDKSQLSSNSEQPLLLIDEPLLRSQIGYDKKYVQITNKTAEAKALLDGAGWKVDPKDGIRVKDGKRLSFKLYSGTDSGFTTISGNLQKQWRELGADVQVQLQSDTELQSTVSAHNYDALLYGISVGPDPDVFAYWHSSQADPRSETRLNFSEYKSTPADKSLEAGRTRSDPQIRAVKYRPFLEAWSTDNPALAMYQPRFLYVVREPLYGYAPKIVNSPADRYANVSAWKVRSEYQKPN